jgi:hypothetical protein
MECFRAASGLFAKLNALPVSSIRESSAVGFGADLGSTASKLILRMVLRLHVGLKL